jgi:hypothetical protein
MEKHHRREDLHRNDGDVRAEVKRLRTASDHQLRSYDLRRSEKRLQWFRSHRPDKKFPGDDALIKAYQVLMDRLQTSEAECPIVFRDDSKLVFHSTNFCPTLEACKILHLDTRHVCKLYNEQSTDTLLKEIHPKLTFTRNYDKLRPYCDYCEEMIVLDE